MGPSKGGVFVPYSWTLLPSEDGPIVHASTAPTPFGPADKGPFHNTSTGEQGGKEGERAEEGSDEVWKGREDRVDRRAKGTEERVVIEKSVLDGRGVVKKKKSSHATLNKPVQKNCAKFLKEIKNNLVMYKKKKKIHLN